MSLYKDCEDCLGSGIAITSNCCDAGYDLDIMICKECKEQKEEFERSKSEFTRRANWIRKVKIN